MAALEKMGRVGVEDLFAHITAEIRAQWNPGLHQRMEDFLAGCTFDLHLSITDDLEETELVYLERHGKGHTFYFRLADYEHGKLLAGQVYWIMLGKRPNLAKYTGGQFDQNRQLYLFVHVRTITPPPIN